MARKYEVILFLNPDLDDTGVAAELKEFEKIIAKAEGTILSKSTPRLMEMGYRIKKKKTGYYVLAEIEINPEEVKTVERALTLQETILRYTVILKKQKKVLL